MGASPQLRDGRLPGLGNVGAAFLADDNSCLAGTGRASWRQVQDPPPLERVGDFATGRVHRRERFGRRDRDGVLAEASALTDRVMTSSRPEIQASDWSCVMLSDRERETLREVQCQLMTEDPDYAQSFEAVGRPDSHYSLHWMYGMPGWVYTTALVVAVALGVLMLLVQAPGTALGFTALATMIAAVRSRRNDAGGPDN